MKMSIFMQVIFAFALGVAANNPSSNGNDEVGLMQTLQNVNRRDAPKEDATVAAADHTFEKWLSENAVFDNQTMMDKFIQQYKDSTDLSLLAASSNETATESSGNTALSAKRSKKYRMPVKYTNMYFKPRLNLCSGSFTGLAACTLEFCSAISTIDQFYGRSCFRAIYSNADGEGGMGMCRCMPITTTRFTRYSSNAGNNIYSDESWM